MAANSILDILPLMPSIISHLADIITVGSFLQSCLDNVSAHDKDSNVYLLLNKLLEETYDNISKNDASFTLRSELFLELIKGSNSIRKTEQELRFIEDFNKRLASDEYASLYGYINEIRNREDRYRQKMERLRSRGIKSIEQKLSFGHTYTNRNINLLNTEYAIQNNWIYQDEDNIERIHNNLEKYHLCIIVGAEGRGKSILCNVAGYKFYQKNILSKVYFIDLRNDRGTILNDLDNTLAEFVDQDHENRDLFIWESLHSSSDLNSLANTLAKLVNRYGENRYLFILENLHNFSDDADGIAQLSELIDKYRMSSYSQFYFLLNTRPFADSPEFHSEPYTIVLSPDEKMLREVISLDRKDPENLFLKNFMSARSAASKKHYLGFNLRLLSLCLDKYSELPENPDIPPRDIAKCILANILGGLPLTYDYKQALFYIACVSQFDLPVYISSTHTLHRTMYTLAQNGACILDLDDNPRLHAFQLSHPVDAYFLARGIEDDGGYESKGIECVIDYIKSMLDIPNCSSLEVHFATLMHKLHKERAWSNGLSRLFDVSEPNSLAADIVEKLNPGFILVIFSCEDITNDQKLRFYCVHKQSICEGCRKRPSLAIRLWKAMRKYYKYDLSQDLFSTPQELAIFLERCLINIGSSIRQNIKSRGQAYEDLLDVWLQKRNDRAMKNGSLSLGMARVIHYVSPRAKEGKFQCINYHLILRIWSEYNSLKSASKTILYEVVQRSEQVGFLLDNISWKSYGTLLKLVQKLREELEDVTIWSFSMRLQALGLSHTATIVEASSLEFSLFLSHIYSADDGFYDYYIRDIHFIENIEHRISLFSFQEEELYLYSHFIHNDLLFKKFQAKLSEATDAELERVKAWIEKVCQNTIGQEIAPDSLAGYLSNWISDNNNSK